MDQFFFKYSKKSKKKLNLCCSKVCRLCCSYYSRKPSSTCMRMLSRVRFIYTIEVRVSEYGYAESIDSYPMTRLLVTFFNLTLDIL